MLLTTLDMKVDRLTDDMAVVKTALTTHGTMLNIVLLDVREIRTRLDAMERRMDEQFDAVLQAVRGLAGGRGS
jgi:hypothetical protein